MQLSKHVDYSRYQQEEETNPPIEKKKVLYSRTITSDKDDVKS